MFQKAKQELTDSLEKFEDIPGFPGYKVSQLGQVKSYKKDENGILLKKRPNIWGYHEVEFSLGSRDRKKFITVHRLVALVWVPKIPGKDHVNHKDCNKINNICTNLEWVTRKENAEHAKRMGRYLPVTGENHWSRKRPWMKNIGTKNGRAKLSAQDVIQIKFDLKNTSAKELAKKFGVSGAVISSIRREITWKHIQK